MPNSEEVPESTSVDEGVEEVKEVVAEEATETEKETPTELPAEEEKPAEQEAEPLIDDKESATKELERTIQGLRNELVKKHKEVAELRGQKREISKSEELIIDKKIDELQDLNPQDVSLIDRIMKAKGMMTKEEFQRSTYEQVKKEELDSFLDRYPEYKPENDPGDVNWTALNKEIGMYRMPTDPRQLKTILERAHGQVARIPSDRSIPVKKRQMQTAGVGGGGTQRSSAQKSSGNFTREQRAFYEKGGWSDADINEMEQNLQ